MASQTKASEYTTAKTARGDDGSSSTGLYVMLLGTWYPFIVIMGCTYMLSPCQPISGAKSLLAVLAASAVGAVAVTPCILYRAPMHGKQLARARRKCALILALTVCALILNLFALRSREHCITAPAEPVPSRTCARVPVCKAPNPLSVIVNGPNARIQRSGDTWSNGPIVGHDELAIFVERVNDTFYVLRGGGEEVTIDVSKHLVRASFGVVGAWDMYGHQLRMSIGDATSPPPPPEFRQGDVWVSLSSSGSTFNIKPEYNQLISALVVARWEPPDVPPCSSFCAEEFLLGQPQNEILTARVVFPLGLYMLKSFNVFVFEDPWI